jgi:putative nucleotidyltransferase with HDIG domain
MQIGYPDYLGLRLPKGSDMTNRPMPVRILVVEDEEAIGELIVSILASAGYECRQAADGEEALAALASAEPFDLVLSNLMMPRLDGRELLQRVKAEYPDIPFIVETAVHDVPLRATLMREGAYDYLLKPFEPDQLLAAVHRALEYSRLKLENRAYLANLESLVATRTEQLRQAVTTLERSYDISVDFMGDAMALNDVEAEGHSKRVAAFTIAIARATGVPTDRIRIIARGAYLHDIGELAIPDAILLKPTTLTAEEMVVMRHHCLAGHEIVKKVPFLDEAAEIVYAHHESYDGTGYPRGLKGEEIPLSARMVAIADTLDAIISDQSYRCAQPVSAARKEIRRCSGTQFDPKIVETFMAMDEHIWGDLRKEIDAGTQG